jgi:hypothetical protein
MLRDRTQTTPVGPPATRHITRHVSPIPDSSSEKHRQPPSASTVTQTLNKLRRICNRVKRDRGPGLNRSAALRSCVLWLRDALERRLSG